MIFIFRFTSGQTGQIFVTTLKISFQEHVNSGGEKDKTEDNKLLAKNDIPLSR